MLRTPASTSSTRNVGHKKTKRVCIFFRGLGNLASKLIYLSAKPKNRKPDRETRFAFRYGIIKPDEITISNLKFLFGGGFFPDDVAFFVVGKVTDERRINRIVGAKIDVFNERDLSTYVQGATLYMDFTSDAKPFVSMVRDADIATPIVVQSNNYGSGILWIPPLKQKGSTNSEQVFRAADCSLSGTIPVLARIKSFFKNLSINFLTDINIGKGPKSNVNNVFYFSDSFPRRRSREFSELTEVDSIVNIESSHVVNPFYIATVSGMVKSEKIMKEFGSWTRFAKCGFAPLLSDARQIIVSTEDNTLQYSLPPEPPNISDFSDNYPDLDSPPCIVYFKRTFIRRKDQVSFKIGFDVNLTATMSNLDLMEAITSDKEQKELKIKG